MIGISSKNRMKEKHTTDQEVKNRSRQGRFAKVNCMVYYVNGNSQYFK